MLTGAAAGLIFGIQDALTRQTLQALHHFGFGGLLLHWPPYALVGAGALGIWLMQSAFSAGPLNVSLPAISAGEPVVGILLGVVVFGDRVQDTPGELAIYAGGLAALVAGVIMVGRAPALSQLRAWTEESIASLPHVPPLRSARPHAPAQPARTALRPLRRRRRPARRPGHRGHDPARAPAARAADPSPPDADASAAPSRPISDLRGLARLRMPLTPRLGPPRSARQQPLPAPPRTCEDQPAPDNPPVAPSNQSRRASASGRHGAIIAGARPYRGRSRRGLRHNSPALADLGTSSCAVRVAEPVSV